VLLIDLDPQGGCAVSLGLDTSTLQRTVYNVLINEDAELAKVIMKTEVGFDLVPANIDLAGAEVELKQVLAQETVLQRRLQPILEQYDYIFPDQFLFKELIHHTLHPFLPQASQPNSFCRTPNGGSTPQLPGQVINGKAPPAPRPAVPGCPSVVSESVRIPYWFF
jgi:hypothetical protein